MRVTSSGLSKASPVSMLAADNPTLLADIEASRGVNISQCETVCLTLGPYRNLTTLTAATLFLHPHCQVLNHAGIRVYASPQLDFFQEFTPAKMDRFLRYAIHISASGERGYMGGSILHSHAFDDEHAMKAIFASTGEKPVKPVIRSLFWKESLLTANHIRALKVDFAHLFSQEARLRFMLPIRNPLDCAMSNLKTEHVRHFEGLSSEPNAREVIQAVLEEIFWVAELRERFPTRFFWYFEHTIDATMLRQMAAFLKLEAGEAWLKAALAAMDIKKGYVHSAADLEWYRHILVRQLSRFPALTTQLLRFADPDWTAR